MNINGRFSQVSKSDYHDGIVLVGFCGDVYPHDLNAKNIKYIKVFCNMPDSEHEILTEWPESIEPAYPAAKKNFVNGFLLLKYKDGEKAYGKVAGSV